MSNCQIITDLGCVDEGSDSSYLYSFLDKEGDPITVAEKIQYKLSDGVNILIPWANINPPMAPVEIEIAGTHNRVKKNSPSKRILSIFVTHGGGKTISKTIEYGIIKSSNIDESSPSP